MTDDIKATGLDAVIAGDFNSKSPMWGSPVTDIRGERGEYLMEWAAELGLNAINVGDTPTFERGASKASTRNARDESKREPRRRGNDTAISLCECVPADGIHVGGRGVA
ncbi:Endonuclease-reverse transcriptase [Popillia japonica]|uniref:Endonuclease-reverse transcriptase n=1 Tax=Popillia japonica TaxID=7064 RepID=A0AAW1LDJ1_POPJA